MIAALLLAAAAPGEISWVADATVHAGTRDIPIRSRTRLSGDGSIVGDSWPVAEGEAKGLRRMIITPGGGWIERNGQRSLMPGDMLAEERRQYGFYLEYQQADAWCRAERQGVRQFGNTNFRCRKGQVTRAANWMGTVRQDFRLRGTVRSNGAAMPLALELRRDRQPYFTMRIERLSAR